MMNRLLGALGACFLGLAAGCDNVGRAFDRDVDPGGPGGGPGTSNIEVVPIGGDVRDGRPKVRAAFPSGSGWPSVVPVVVEFTESVNRSTIQPTSPTGGDGRIVLRARGTTQVLPCQYDFLAANRVLVMRPVTALPNTNAPTYQVVLLPEARDADGARFDVPTGGTVLTEFQVNQAESFTDGRILTTYPRDNGRDATRETDYFVFFDRPANEASVTTTNLRLRRRGGTDLVGQRTFPLSLVGVVDGRVLRFRPENRLLATTWHELVVDDTITFGTSGKLDFRGRTPFASFQTVGPAAPAGVLLGNPTPATFVNKINRANAGVAVLHVTTAADTEAGDRIRGRIYGSDASTASNTADLGYVERIVTVPAAGTQSVVLDFSGRLGTLTKPSFDDGPLTFAVQTQRGSQQSGFVHNDAADAALFDITLPTLRQAGPPSLGSAFDVAIDQEYLAFYGTASEAVGEVLLTDGGPEVGLFAAAADGTFLMRPLRLGRLTGPRSYSLTLRDRAGNLATGAVSGSIRQRGVVTGVVAGELTVEVYDHTTLAPVANAKVLVDPGAPSSPAVNQLVGTTGADGRVVFQGLAGSEHTVTVVRSGFDLVTVYRSGAAFLSLPLRPQTAATATLQGNVAFTVIPGSTALVGCTSLDDANDFAVATTVAAPTTIPPVPILPNRPAIVTAFAGAFEPSARPTFSFQGFQSLGTDLTTPTPPLAPPAAGGTSNQNLILLPSIGQIGFLLGPYTVDFGLAAGLDAGNLIGGRPVVRVTSSLQGFGGQLLMGVGFAQAGAGTTYDIDVNWTLPGFIGLSGFGAELATWGLSEARDQGGRISRHRVLVDVLTGLLQGAFLPPQSIPLVTAPGLPFVGSPLVEYADVLDPTATVGGVAVVDVVATDANGRRWTMLVADTDAAGGTESVQFPDLSNAGTPGLAVGNWTMRVEARLWLSLSSASFDDCVLAERRHAEILYSRGSAVTFVVQ